MVCDYPPATPLPLATRTTVLLQNLEVIWYKEEHCLRP
jgi:hypothetical protein